MRFICSLRDDKAPDHIPSLISDDPAAIAAFIKKWDLPGRGVYECVGTLKPGATRRCLENIGELHFIHVDIDFRGLITPQSEVLQKLQALPLPLELRESGGGYHGILYLKEPANAGTSEFDRINILRKRLTRILCGDPAPDHAAALLRIPGTTNTKHGKPRLCRIIRQGEPVDITEIEEAIDLLADKPLFEPKASNGHDRTAGEPRLADDAFREPVNVAERFAAMAYKGGGHDAVHPTQLSCTAALLSSGTSVAVATEEVLAATRNAVAGTPEAAAWDWQTERLTVERMCFDWINKKPELATLLPDALYEAWQQKLAAGKQPRVSRNAEGWHIRSYDSNNNDKETPDPNPRPTNKDAAKKIRAIPFTLFDEATLRRRAHLYAKHYQRGQCTATIGCDGAGKSTVSIAEAIVMAMARNLLGEQPEERCRVWLHNADDDTEEMYRRIAAFCRLHQIPMEELVGWLFVTGKDKFRITVASSNGNLAPDHRSIAQITETIVENQIDVCIFDPLVALHAVAENDNVRMSEVIHIFGNVAASCDCAVDICHHTRKPSAGTDEKEFNSDDSRGASAVRAAVRASRVFNRMSKAEAEKAGIGEEDRVWYIRIDRGKANYLPPAIKATWYQLKSVELLNGDHVGAIVAWLFPGQDGQPLEEKAKAEQTAEHVFMQLLARLTLEGRTVSDRKGINYAPQLFATEKEAKVAKVGKSALADAMRRLFAAGRIRAEDSGAGGRRVHYIALV